MAAVDQPELGGAGDAPEAASDGQPPLPQPPSLYEELGRVPPRAAHDGAESEEAEEGDPSHPLVGEGLVSVSGAIFGAALGSLAGASGAIIGAVLGAAAGWVAGRR